MRNILSIAGKEVRLSFTTPLAWVVIAGFVFLSGFFFFNFLQQYNIIVVQSAMIPDLSPNLNEMVIQPLFQTIEIVLIFLIPILTMRAIAEERKSQTFELLATSPLSASEILLGKFIGVSAVLLVMLGISFVFPLILVLFADPEVPPILVGCLGVMLFALALCSLGIMVSSCTKSQTVAGVISLVLLLVFFVVDAPAESLGGVAGEVLKYLAPSNHIEPMLKGVLTGVDLVYFASVALLGLFVAGRVLDAERWR